MSVTPYSDLPKTGVVAVSSPDYLRIMLDHLSRGVVSVPLRHSDDRERLSRSGAQDVIIPDEGHGWTDLPFTSRGGDDLAQVSFTSGTEGTAKAVYLSHGNLHDAVSRLTDVMGLTSSVREYIGVPVYHSFGYGRARAVLNAGGQVFLPEKGFDPIEIRQMLRAGEINAISAVPSLWRVFLQARDLFGAELESVRWVEIGSQFMAAADKAQLRQMLPNARIVQHYGLTEASRTTFLRIDDADPAALESVGRPVGQTQVRIDDDGRILICGPHVALGIDDGTAWQPLGAGDWFRTSDQGRMDGDLLYFLGRADDVINLSGVKLVPDLIEAHVRSRLTPGGDFCVLRRDDALRGEGIHLALTPGAMPDQTAIIDAIEDYAQAQGASARAAIRVRPVDELPRTATGKIQRKALMVQEDATTAPVATGLEQEIADLLGAQMPPPGSSDSFLDIGGDSLTHIQMIILLERALGAAPMNWESLPLRALHQQQPQDSTGPGAPPLPAGDRNMNPSGITFWDLVREDCRTNGGSLTHQGFLMLFVHRFGNWRMSVRPKLLRAPLTILYRLLNKMTQLLFGMKLDYTVKVGRRVRLEHFGGMILGAREIGDEVILRQNTTMGIRSVADLNAKPTLGKGVDVGAGAVIVGNIHIGDYSVIGANTVVAVSVPPHSIVQSAPVRVIRGNGAS